MMLQGQRRCQGAVMGSFSAPDAVEAIVGWRAWAISDVAGTFRLRSVVAPTLWPAREVLEAECLRPGLHFLRRWRFGHKPPSETCECGVYAADASTAASYGTPPADRVDRRILGRVALWGVVVECEHGWRASHAYPYEIVIPAHRFRDDTRVPLEVLAFDLTAYGVPVTVVDEDELSELMHDTERIEAE
jgi:hypothetical protein